MIANAWSLFPNAWSLFLFLQVFLSLSLVDSELFASSIFYTKLYRFVDKMKTNFQKSKGLILLTLNQYMWTGLVLDKSDESIDLEHIFMYIGFWRYEREKSINENSSYAHFNNEI